MTRPLHDRERGAAHVPVIVFLLTLILFFGALGFAYVVMEKNNDLEGRIATAVQNEKDVKAKLFFYDHYVKDITAEIGEAGEWKGRPGFDYSNYDIDPAEDALLGVALPSLVKERIAEFARVASVPATQGIATFFGHVKTTLDANAGRVKALEETRDALTAQVAEVQSAVDAASSQRESEVAAIAAQLAQKDSEYSSLIDEKDQLITKGTATQSQLREEMTTTKEDSRQLAKKLNKEIEVRNAIIDARSNKLQLINPPHSADASVVSASAEVNKAWIDIGRQQMLPVGTLFDITEDGSDKVKATAIVERVDNNKAQLRIVKLTNRFDPVVAGDVVRNDLFSPNVRRNVFLLGRFGDPSKPMIKAMLQNLGNNVLDELSPSVDLVIVGHDPINEDSSGYIKIMDTAEYKEVQRLRIETAPMNKVRNFLKLSD